MTEKSKWFKVLEPHLLSVAMPGQYVGGEWNSANKNPEAVDINFALCFPDTYSVGMSTHGLRILYEILNNQDWVYAQRCHTPLPDMEGVLRKNNIPLCTLESFTSLNECDIVGFSLQYEMCATNILTMLDLGKIPVLRSERKATDPLVCAGAALSYNPEPFADFIDFFMLGDGEEAILEVSNIVRQCKKDKISRKETLLRLAREVQGCYCPEFYDVKDNVATANVEGIADVVMTRRIDDLDKYPYPVKPIVPVVQTAHERITIEVMRGCPNGCRFCQAGMINRPVRFRTIESVMEIAGECYKNTGYDEIGLLSLSTSDHTCFAEMVSTLSDKFSPLGVNLSLPSLRVDSALRDIPDTIKSVRKGGFTIAPEAGSDRLRAVINKHVTDENLLEGAEAIFRAGWRSIKLYFMVGLPTERDEDVIAIPHLAERVAKLAGRGKKSKGQSVTCSVSNFVPKPFTPFQWQKMDSAEEFERKHELIRKEINRKLVNYKGHDINTSMLEGVLSRGGRDVGKLILQAWKNGARLCAWSEYFSSEKWKQAQEQTGIKPCNTTCKGFSGEEKLPWSHISCGVSEGFLKREWERSQSARPSPKCGEACLMCGVGNCQLKPSS